MLTDTLPAGKLDIIGDVHGHFDALTELLDHLGYRDNGSHPAGRRLVFVGDLADRGPDSPAVFAWVMAACAAGRAHMVLGNHEANLLTGEAKDGSGWFFAERSERDGRNYAPWQTLPAGEHGRILDFLAQQPLLLERSDLRIVHAAWQDKAVETVRRRRSENLADLYQEWEDDLCRCIRHAPWYDDYLDEQRRYAHLFDDPAAKLPLLAATAAHDVYRNGANPLRMLTCGPEASAAAPFFAGGRWRFSVREPWWNRYTASAAVVIGHYWRPWQGEAAPRRSEMFTVPPHHWHGAGSKVFCCDFSVGARWRERKRHIAPQHSAYRLAALRWPEKILITDRGEQLPTV